MTHIIVATHGKFSEEIVNSAAMEQERANGNDIDDSAISGGESRFNGTISRCG